MYSSEFVQLESQGRIPGATGELRMTSMRGEVAEPTPTTAWVRVLLVRSCLRGLGLFCFCFSKGLGFKLYGFRVFLGFRF